MATCSPKLSSGRSSGASLRWRTRSGRTEPGRAAAVPANMAQREMTQEWKEWVATTVQRGASVDAIFNPLVREGFQPDSAARELNIRRVALKRFPSDRIELYTAENFLLPQECEELIEIIRNNLRPSEISHDGSADSSFRTSRTCDLVRGEEAVRILDERICGAMGIEPKFTEPSQGQYYDVAQEFK